MYDRLHLGFRMRMPLYVKGVKYGYISMWKHILWAIVQCGSLSVLRYSNVEAHPMGYRPMRKSFGTEEFQCERTSYGQSSNVEVFRYRGFRM